MLLTKRILVRFNVPQTVHAYSVLVAGDLLLLVRPIRQLDLIQHQCQSQSFMKETHLVTEEIATRELVTEFEDTPERPDASTALSITAPAASIPLASTIVTSTFLIEFDDKVVIGIALKAIEAVTGNLLLEIHFADGRTDVVTVEVFVRLGVS